MRYTKKYDIYRYAPCDYEGGVYDSEHVYHMLGHYIGS